MNRKQIIHDVLDGKPQDRLPRAVFGGGLWAFHTLCLLPARISVEPKRFVQELSYLYGDLDTDIVFLGSGLNSFPAEALGARIQFRGEHAPLLEHPVIHSSKDLARFEKIDFSNSPYVLALVQVVQGLARQFPDRFTCVTGCGPFTWALLLCDWDLLKRKLADDPPFVDGVCELGVRLTEAFVDAVREGCDLDGVSVPEGAVTLISDEQYEERVFPHQVRLFKSLRKKNLRTVLHMCGNTETKLDRFHHTGAECVTVDDHVTMKRTYDLFRGKVTAAGNVPVVNVIEKGTPEKIREETANCVGQVKDPKTGYILMPSCDLPVNTPFENVKTFLSCADFL
jgi:uroporphyrinogen decarboxylase